MEAARHILPEIPEIVLDFPSRRQSAAKPVARPSFAFRKFLTVLCVVGLAAFVNVYQKALIAQNGINISRLKYEIAEEERAGKTLKVQHMLLESPSRLERLAVNRLDMVKPENINYIVIPAEASGRTVTENASHSHSKTTLSGGPTLRTAMLGKFMTKVSLLVE
jgi:hypothetical protein